jgi:hypothetical protein
MQSWARRHRRKSASARFERFLPPKSPGNAGAARSPGSPSVRLARRREPRRLAPGRAAKTATLRTGASGAAGAAASGPPGDLAAARSPIGWSLATWQVGGKAAPAAAAMLRGIIPSTVAGEKDADAGGILDTPWSVC